MAIDQTRRPISGPALLTQHAFIIGGTGQIGLAAAEELTRAGWNVTVSHRGHRPPPTDSKESGIKSVTLDRNKPLDLTKAIRAGADLVVDTIAYGPKHADQLLELQKDVGAFVVISSASVYCDTRGRTLAGAEKSGFPDVPHAMNENQITVSPGNETYSSRKVALELILLNESTKPVTVLRPCAVHGIGSQHPREWWFVKRMLDGRELIPLAYRGESRFSTTSVANIAALIQLVSRSPGTRILNVADFNSPSVAEIGSAISANLDYKGKFVLVNDSSYPTTIGGTPWSVPAPFTLDNSAAIALGYEPLTYADSVQRTCDWLVQTSTSGDWQKRFPVLAGYPEDLFGYAAEDKYFAEKNIY